jgi:hypothetical protein
MVTSLLELLSSLIRWLVKNNGWRYFSDVYCYKVYCNQVLPEAVTVVEAVYRYRVVHDQLN